MRAEILAANPASKIRILGVNRAGQEPSNDLVVAGHTTPWLQDPIGLVWSSWRVTWRDVVILDPANRTVGVFNLTQHNLTDPTQYAALLAMLKSAAGE